MDEKCSICGCANEDYMIKLECGHTFHYECILLTFINSRNKQCPYCRREQKCLPVIKGVKKIIPWIHSNYYDYNTILDIDKNVIDISEYKVQKCYHILMKGKNKGKTCSHYCKLGYDVCHKHLKLINKKKENISDIKNNQKVIV